jgi:asparagine synthase (glutamine-hydrolysing)
MCGICGIVHRERTYPLSESVVISMRDSLTHRGPDDAGHSLAPGVALGSRRLAILDLSARGHMPMATADGRYQIVYNGEVYNYRELKRLLQARGYTFHSNTDTEVLLNLYADIGPAMLDRLNGMFAIAIWDSVERSLFLARDRLGVKPLYYAVQGGALFFASEEKALFAAGIVPEFDESHWDELLCFRYVSGEETPFAGVKRLLPGHYLQWKEGQLQIRRWWVLSERARALRAEKPPDPVVWFREVFDSAVSLRRISDVPVGVLLSGGLDSSSVAASLASDAGSGVASFTVRFDEATYDEGPLAQEIARRWKLDYHELKVSPQELLQRLHSASWLNDEPLVHGNDVHLWAISEFAKPRVTVLLSGEGADETLGGYVRYRPLQYPSLLNLARPLYPRLSSMLHLDGRFDKMARFLKLGSIDRMVLFNACDVLPEDLEAIGRTSTSEFPYRESVLKEARSTYPTDPMRQAMYSDQHTFLCSVLDRNDRMTMGASIECRVPFLDYRLVEGLAAFSSSVLIAKRESKHLLRDSVGDRLPETIRRHRKWGFGVPWGRYMREDPDFKKMVKELPVSDPIRDGPFSHSRLSTLVNDFLAGSPRYEALVRNLLFVSIWHQACLRANSSTGPGSDKVERP